MNERTDCAFYSEWQDMNAAVPCCDIYGIGNCKCLDCKKYVSKDDRVLVVRCKDCKYSVCIGEHYFCDIQYDEWGQPYVVKPDGYCDVGERRD